MPANPTGIADATTTPANPQRRGPLNPASAAHSQLATANAGSSKLVHQWLGRKKIPATHAVRRITAVASLAMNMDPAGPRRPPAPLIGGASLGYAVIREAGRSGQLFAGTPEPAFALLVGDDGPVERSRIEIRP